MNVWRNRVEDLPDLSNVVVGVRHPETTANIVLELVLSPGQFFYERQKVVACPTHG